MNADFFLVYYATLKRVWGGGGGGGGGGRGGC